MIEILKKVEFPVPLKYLSNFWRILDILLINYEGYLTLTWFSSSVLTAMITRAAGNNNDPPAIEAPTGATFSITDAKIYIPEVSLSTEDENDLLQQLKAGFKTTVKWNKYRSDMSNQTKKKNLDYLIDPTFNKVNRLIVLSFKNDNENKNDRFSFSKYFVPKVEFKNYNVLIDGKSVLAFQ